MTDLRATRIAALLALLPALAGCGTLANTFEPEPKNKIYVGVRADLNEWTLAHGGFLDLPFSFVLDTILLPYTIPKTIANYAAEEEEKPDETKSGEDGGG